MRQSVINYVKENGIKLAANSKALKLINNGASEAEVAVALQTTKAYKEDSTLRQMCQEVVAEAGKEQADSRNQFECGLQEKKMERYFCSVKNQKRVNLTG